ncbi:MAG: transcription initiation factor TFIIIB [Thaumarchaeota archaeon]|nr:transcription initiation factor TFIIIB [Nitrososphaerota archaeon]
MAKTNKTQILYGDSNCMDVTSKRMEALDIASPKCPTRGCKGAPIITDTSSGEIICGSCGFVLLERSIDPNPEHISDASEFISKARTGPEQSLAMYDMGMMTVISDKDAMGRSLSSYMKNTFGRLKVLNSRSRTASSNRTLRSALLLLYSLKTKLGLPDSTVENSAYLYRKAMQKRITIGRSAKGIMCASVYLACRQTDIPRSLIDISRAANVSKKEVSRACRNLIEKLEMSLDPSNPAEFVTKIAHEANISEKAQREALKILLQLSEKGISAGKNPMALAAATLYLSCILNGEKKTQFEIAKASGITSVTIRNRYTALKKEIKIQTEKDKDLN